MTPDTVWKLYTSNWFVLAMEPSACWVCGIPTRYIEINFETNICPGICDWAAGEAYFLALRGNDPWREPTQETEILESTAQSA